MNIDHIARSVGVDVDSIHSFGPGWIEELERFLLVEKVTEALVKDLVVVFQKQWGGAWAENHNPLQVAEVTRLVCDHLGLNWKNYI